MDKLFHPPRDLRIDFVRGLALLAIVVSHTNPNVLKKFMPTAFGFSDAAEAFFFLSGYVAGVAYGKVFRDHGYLFTQFRVLHRCGQIYVAHLFTIIVCLAVPGVFGVSLAEPTIGADLFVTDPASAIRQTVALNYFPWAHNILPVYLIILPTFPVMQWIGSRAGPLTMVGVSFGVYAVVQVRPDVVTLPGEWGRAWYFNPFAWQFIFYLGVGLSTARGSIAAVFRRVGGTVPVAVVVVLLAFALKIGYAATHQPDFFHNLFEVIRAKSPGPIPDTMRHPFPGTGKTTLQPLRLIHFMAVVVLCARFLSVDWVGRTAWLQPILACGRNSLSVFCFGSVVVYASNSCLITYGSVFVWQCVITMVAVLAVLAFGCTLRYARHGPWPRRGWAVS